MDGRRRPRWRSRGVAYALAWVIAAACAVTVGVVAVSSVGASFQERGPLGHDVRRGADQFEGGGSPEPGATRIRRTVDGAFGRFLVECRGVVAYGVSATTRDGWRTVSYEPGPDDDVDAVFARGDGSIELEVYCNQGRPTIAEREYKTLPHPN